MSLADKLLDHDPEVCGICFKNKIHAELAREMLASGNAGEDAIGVFCDEEQRRWRDSKFYKLWQEETAAGRQPQKAFADRGWEP